MYVTPIAPLFLTRHVMLDISRYGEGLLVKGRYQPGARTILTVKANIQPILRETDKLMLAEGERHKQAVRIFTQVELLPVREGAPQTEPDRFVWQGDTYEIRKVTAWKMGILDHYESVAIKVEVT